MGSQWTSNLIELPPEIHKCIIQALKFREPLFLPRYGVRTSEDCDGTAENPMEQESEKYYGKQPDEHEEYVTGLLNLSMTCRYFHNMIVPHLYETIVLRAKPRSLRSIEILSKTPHWSRVSHLIFAGVWDTRDRENPEPHWFDVDRNTWNTIVAERQRTIETKTELLKSILSSLPPGLNVLTLDFPQTWEVADSTEDLENLILYDSDEEDELQAIEKNDFFRAQHAAVFGAIGSASNIASIANKSSFELRLHNITPLYNTSYRSGQFRNFLHQVTKFKLALCYGESGSIMNMNTSQVPPVFGEHLSEIFFNHLERCTHLTIHASTTWPLGLGQGYNHIDLPLPRTTAHLPNVTHVDLKHCFIDPKVIAFLTSHLSNLTSIDMTDCYANGADAFDNIGNAPNWSDFFAALSTAENPPPSRLTQLSITNPSDTLKDLTEGHHTMELLRPQRERIHDILNRQHEDENRRCRDEGDEVCKDDIVRRRKRIYNYTRIDGKYGFLYANEQKNIERFLTGDDHDEWIKLLEVVEANVRRTRGEDV